MNCIDCEDKILIRRGNLELIICDKPKASHYMHVLHPNHIAHDDCLIDNPVEPPIQPTNKIENVRQKKGGK